MSTTRSLYPRYQPNSNNNFIQNRSSLILNENFGILPTSMSLLSSLLDTSCMILNGKPFPFTTQFPILNDANINPTTTTTFKVLSELTTIKDPIKSPFQNITTTTTTTTAFDNFSPLILPTTTTTTATTTERINSIFNHDANGIGFETLQAASTIIDNLKCNNNNNRQIFASERLCSSTQNEEEISINSESRKSFSDFSINRLLKNQNQTKRSSIPSSVDRRQFMFKTQEERNIHGRKQRTIYGTSQTRVLEKAFEEQQYMVGTG